MSDEKQPGTPDRRMREEAEELELAAQHAADPDERRRLTDEALRIRKRIERESGPEGATMDPM